MMTKQSLSEKWQKAFSTLPLIAILRGIKPDECIEVAGAIFDQGFEILEVPLNSPDPFASISTLCKAFPDRLIGAGTVTSAEAVVSCVDVGCELIIAPNFNSHVACVAKEHKLIYCPGVATPSEAFMALEAGADSLKLFPAELISPSIVKALRAVLPLETTLIPVGGITPDNMAEYQRAGANGFGIGSALYKPGKSIADILRSASDFASEINNQA